jgi:hypothetical protein
MSSSAFSQNSRGAALYLSPTGGLPPASNTDREVRRAGPKELYTPLGQC